jgi:hypothetical protein
MHISLSRNETIQTFNIWVYGEERLVRGSGLFVGETGVATSHHFLLPSDGSHFIFSAGIYKLEVFSKMLGNQRTIKLFSERLEISQENAKRLTSENAGLFFDWGPDSSRYLAHIETKALHFEEPSPLELLDSLLASSMEKNLPSDASH